MKGKTYMKIKFYLDRYVSKNGDSTIQCIIREGKESFYLHTNELIKPEFWDTKTQRANLRKTRDNITKKSLNDLNEYLNKFEGNIKAIIREQRAKDPGSSFVTITDAIKKKFDNKKDGLLDIYDEFLEIKKKKSINSYKKLKRVKGLIEDYQKAEKEKLNFDKITPLFFDKFYSFLIENKNLINNTAGKYVQLFKMFLIWCNINGYTNNMSYKSFRVKSETNEVIYLTEDELLRLYELTKGDILNYREPHKKEDSKPSKGEKIIGPDTLLRVRDLFCFQCYTGVRFSDLRHIAKEDIKNNTWYVRTQKTHDPLEIPLNGYAVSILAKYSEQPQPLPVISNQKMNLYLKELCKVAGIDEPIKIVKYKGNERVETISPKWAIIGSHTARRSFVTLSLQKGMKPDVIMSITGHRTYKMLQKYLKIANKFKREEMDKVWGSPLRIAK
jgi:integrase